MIILIHPSLLLACEVCGDNERAAAAYLIDVGDEVDDCYRRYHKSWRIEP